MTRRRFAFWLGFGMFALADKLHLNVLDAWAASTMDGAAEPNAAKVRTAKAPSREEPAAPEHWTVSGDQSSRWFERENYIDGEWILTGRTMPIDKETGRPWGDDDIYLDERLVPTAMRAAEGELADGEIATPADDEDEDEPGAAARPQAVQPLGHLPLAKRRSRHGRPPSKWLRSLNADEIRIWLTTVKVPEAGVSGMTYWEHLTRDHVFDPTKIKGLTEPEQAALHGAAHFGY